MHACSSPRCLADLRWPSLRLGVALCLCAFFSMIPSVRAELGFQASGSSIADPGTIQVDLGPFDSPTTRQALELRRDKLVFAGESGKGWKLRVRALDEAQRSLSAIFSQGSSQHYIQEFSLDPGRGDAERQIATSLVNWIDAVLANQHRPATEQQVQAQRRKERAMPAQASAQEVISDAKPQDDALAPEVSPQETRFAEDVRAGKKNKASKRTRAKPNPRRTRDASSKSRSQGSWSFISPTRWELGVGLGVAGSLQGRPWLPGWSWLDVHALWTPKTYLRLLVRTRWQSHALDQEYVHRVRVAVGPEWMARQGRFGIPLGWTLSAERWWAKKELKSAAGLTRIVSLGLQAHAGVSWRLLEKGSGILVTALQAELRYSSEIPGWVLPTVSLQPGGPRLFVGGLEWGLLWSLRWGKKRSRRVEGGFRAAQK